MFISKGLLGTSTLQESYLCNCTHLSFPFPNFWSSIYSFLLSHSTNVLLFHKENRSLPTAPTNSSPHINKVKAIKIQSSFFLCLSVDQPSSPKWDIDSICTLNTICLISLGYLFYFLLRLPTTSSISAFMSPFFRCINLLPTERLFNLKLPAGLVFFKFQIFTHTLFGNEVVWHLRYQNATHTF